VSRVKKKPGKSSFLGMLCELAKVRITFAVSLTMATGYVMQAGGFDWGMLLPLLGTFLLASGSAALNEVQEHKHDAKMPRTQHRPIPSGRITPHAAFFVAGLLILAGLYLLSSNPWHPNTLTALGILALVWYNAVYTPLKRVTPFAVVPGALIGAIPPVMGWVAAGGLAGDPTILLVASFFFLWQIPHFWLLLLLYGKEYEDAGFPSLTTVFSQSQLFRITFMWLIATAVWGMGFPHLSAGMLSMPWSIILTLGSIWVALKGAAILWRHSGRPYLRAFLQINLYALLIMICLTCSALGLGWR
jgi:heme o synthase